MLDIFLCFVLLQIGDVLTTIRILNKGGKELNPILNYLFNRIGMKVTLVCKAILVIVIAWFLCQYSDIAIIIVTLLYAIVVGWNSYQIFISENRS